LVVNKELNKEDSNNNNINSKIQSHSFDHNISSKEKPIKIKLPKLILLVLFSVWITYAAIYISSVTAVPNCSTPYYILISITYPILIITIIWGIRHIAYQQQNRIIEVLRGDIDFSKMTFVPPVGAFVIGILCSLLGIGGGELM
jgi:hypothetical protein